MNASRRMKRLRGFSLVELMVAMTLSLVLLAGALSILYSSKVTYSENDRIARLQEAGRTVVELILRDARAAGFQGCARPARPSDYTNGLTNANTLLWDMDRPLMGFNGAGGAFAPALDVVRVPNATPDSDIIALRTVREGTPSFELDAPVLNASQSLVVRRGANVTVPVGSTMVINDCITGVSVFTVSNFVPLAADTARIDHAQGTWSVATHEPGQSPGNVSNSIGRNFRMPARLSLIDTVVYYVRDSDTGLGPALWRRIGAEQPRPLIEGVENLQIRYGVDTDNNLEADVYQNAAQVDAANNWDRVISLTIAVLVRSETETNLDFDRRTYDMLGEIKGPFDDRRQRSLFITTVALRNQTT